MSDDIRQNKQLAYTLSDASHKYVTNIRNISPRCSVRQWCKPMCWCWLMIEVMIEMMSDGMRQNKHLANTSSDADLWITRKSICSLSPVSLLHYRDSYYQVDNDDGNNGDKVTDQFWFQILINRFNLDHGLCLKVKMATFEVGCGVQLENCLLHYRVDFVIIAPHWYWWWMTQWNKRHSILFSNFDWLIWFWLAALFESGVRIEKIWLAVRLCLNLSVAVF